MTDVQDLEPCAAAEVALPAISHFQPYEPIHSPPRSPSRYHESTHRICGGIEAALQNQSLIPPLEQHLHMSEPSAEGAQAEPYNPRTDNIVAYPACEFGSLPETHLATAYSSVIRVDHQDKIRLHENGIRSVMEQVDVSGDEASRTLVQSKGDTVDATTAPADAKVSFMMGRLKAVSVAELIS